MGGHWVVSIMISCSAVACDPIFSRLVLNLAHVWCFLCIGSFRTLSASAPGTTFLFYSLCQHKYIFSNLHSSPKAHEEGDLQLSGVPSGSVGTLVNVLAVMLRVPIFLE